MKFLSQWCKMYDFSCFTAQNTLKLSEWGWKGFLINPDDSRVITSRNFWLSKPLL